MKTKRPTKLRIGLTDLRKAIKVYWSQSGSGISDICPVCQLFIRRGFAKHPLVSDSTVTEGGKIIAEFTPSLHFLELYNMQGWQPALDAKRTPTITVKWSK